MQTRSTKILLLTIAFIDYLGVGLIYPMFSSMVFDPEYALISQEASNPMRGFILGALLAMMPLIQFFSAPLWGAFSDIKGRKKPLILSLCIALIGYISAYFAASFALLWLLFVSRILVGCSAGNTSIIQASLSDLSDNDSRTKNFALYSMALGSGFTLGPLVGGLLSKYGYDTPFLLASVILFANLIFMVRYLSDTLIHKEPRELKLSLGFAAIGESLTQKQLRGTFYSLFLHNFGWSYFFEFIPVFLFGVMQFSRQKLGIFYAVAGLFYALSAGVLIRPFLKKHEPLVLYRFGLLCSGLVISSMGFITHDVHLWICLFLLCFFVSFVSPSATSYVSNHCQKHHEGRVLGSLNSMNALALILAPLLSGCFVGNFPKMPVFLGGACIIMAAFVSYAMQKKDRQD